MGEHHPASAYSHAHSDANANRDSGRVREQLAGRFCFANFRVPVAVATNVAFRRGCRAEHERCGFCPHDADTHEFAISRAEAEALTERD